MIRLLESQSFRRSHSRGLFLMGLGFVASSGLSFWLASGEGGEVVGVFFIICAGLCFYCSFIQIPRYPRRPCLSLDTANKALILYDWRHRPKSLPLDSLRLFFLPPDTSGDTTMRATGLNKGMSCIVTHDGAIYTLGSTGLVFNDPNALRALAYLCDKPAFRYPPRQVYTSEDNSILTCEPFDEQVLNHAILLGDLKDEQLRSLPIPSDSPALDAATLPRAAESSANE